MQPCCLSAMRERYETCTGRRGGLPHSRYRVTVLGRGRATYGPSGQAGSHASTRGGRLARRASEIACPRPSAAALVQELQRSLITPCLGHECTPDLPIAARTPVP